jgi:hypothetical protein
MRYLRFSINCPNIRRRVRPEFEYVNVDFECEFQWVAHLAMTDRRVDRLTDPWPRKTHRAIAIAYGEPDASASRFLENFPKRPTRAYVPTLSSGVGVSLGSPMESV